MKQVYAFFLVCCAVSSVGSAAVPGDVDQSGGVTAVDVQLVINQALSIPTGRVCDIDGEAGVNALDVQLVINAALGIDISGQVCNPDEVSFVDISIATANELWLGGVFSLDVRTPSEYQGGHIPGAINIPVGELSSRLDELANRKQDDILVYCASGGRSRTAAGILTDNCFTSIHNMLGGFSAWVSASYESVTGPEPFGQ